MGEPLPQVPVLPLASLQQIPEFWMWFQKLHIIGIWPEYQELSTTECILSVLGAPLTVPLEKLREVSSVWVLRGDVLMEVSVKISHGGKSVECAYTGNRRNVATK